MAKNDLDLLSIEELAALRDNAINKLAEKVAARQAELESELQRLSQYGKPAKKSVGAPAFAKAGKSDDVEKKSDEVAKKSDEVAKKSDEVAKKSDEVAKKSDEVARESDEPKEPIAKTAVAKTAVAKAGAAKAA
jgi:methyl-accepting chemotaxis protein